MGTTHVKLSPGTADVAMGHGAYAAASPVSHRFAAASPRAENRLRLTGFAVLSIVAWSVAVGVGAGSPVRVAGLSALSLSVFVWTMRDAGEFVAPTTRIGRYIVAGLALALLAPAASALGAGTPSLRLAGAAVALTVWAALWDLGVCGARRLRRPVRLLVIGSGAAAERLALAFANEQPSRFTLVGFLRAPDEAEGDTLCEPVVGELGDLARALDGRRVDAVVLATPTRRLDVLERILAVPGRPPAVLELSEVYERAFGRVPVGEINAAWFMRALALSRRTSLVLPKRLGDSLVAGLVLALTAPLLLLIAAAIRLDSPGPALYRQRRVGEGGREFTMLKFRSMGQDAERDGVQWAAVEDPRVTRVGRVIRRFRLDELPQLWNVLRGEMSIVGPRPERPELVHELARLLPFYDARHITRPGITGWAQVYAPYGASVDDALQKLSYDLYYLNHGSLFTDLGVMLRTASVMMGGWGAR